jgi:hypothetical protein
MKRIILSLLIFSSLGLAAYCQKTEVFHVKVDAGKFERINTPVSFALDGITIIDSLSYQLVEKAGGKLVEKPFQIEPGYTALLWFVLDGTTAAGKSREYFLYQMPGKHFDEKIITRVTQTGISLKDGASEILNYQTAVHYPPAKVDTAYKRSGYLHPVMSPSGNVLTRIDAPDHYHHFGIWNPWTKVKIRDHVTDFWNLGSKQGTVRFAGINSNTSGPVYGGFSVRQEHIDFRGKKPEELTMNEVWDVRAWNVEPVAGIKAWLVDLSTFLSVAGDSTITFEAYRYAGGIGFRATQEWNKDNSTVLTSEGKTRKTADGSHARWTDINGEFKDNGLSGITFFSHPSNRAHPEPMRVWPESQNGRGDVYFEFCPTRFTDWSLNPGSVYRLKYRMLIYDGKIDKTAADRIWNDFAYPPVVKVVTK